MGSLIDLTGQAFGSWVVLRRAANRGAIPYWLCRCRCGSEVEVRGSNLRTNLSTNCGCERAFVVKHGHARRTQVGKSRTYRIWKGMLSRCHGANAAGNPKLVRYAGRGIEVCLRWRDGFESFLADMGEAPDGLSLDRINNDAGYSPDNCRWAKPVVQRRNSIRISPVVLFGKSMLVADAAKCIGVTSSAIHNDQKRNGGTAQEALDRIVARRS